ncbi:MAG TPA: hypothetical protein VMP89_19300 [Solirubrobacteraceae bacterium]|nr:hypothetical protein [Solirubrobacteraceae bacterium]
MPSKRKRSKSVPLNPTEIADLARSNPYIQRLLEDPKLRKNVSTAINSSKSAYARLTNGKVPTRVILEDKKLHQDVGRALGAARDVTIVLTQTQRRRPRGLTFGRKLLLVAIGGGLALAGSEKLRSKVLDLLFGAEEEFQYTPPATATAPASTTVGAA